MFPFVLFDGEPRELTAVPLSEVPSLLHGAGFFETVRVDDGVPCFLDRHLARLGASLAAVPKVAMPEAPWLTRRSFEEGLRKLWEASAIPTTVVLRIAAVDGHVLCTFRPLPPESPGVVLRDVVRAYVHGDPWPQRKTLSYLRNFAAMDDGVFFTNDADEICEAPAANVFALVDGRLRTPTVTAPCLPGIARAVLLEAGALAGLPLEEGVLSVDDLLDAEACFVTNAVRRAVPVTELLGRPCPGSAELAAEARRLLTLAARRAP